MSKKQQHESTEEKVVNGPGKWIVASLVGIGTGAAKFAADVRNEFFLNTKQYPEVKDALHEHGTNLGLIKDKRLGIGHVPQADIEGIKQADELVKIAPVSTEEFIHSYAKEKNRFFKEVNQFAEKLGIKSTGLGQYFEGSIQRFRTLSETTKIPLVFSASATTVIGFAGTLMLANSLSSRNHLKHIEAALNKKENETTRT